MWHVDRLHRRPIQLEEFVNACTAAGVSDLNLGNGDGLLIARLMAAVATNESDAKSRRSKRKMLELAQAGKPSGGGPRPFGFLPDRVTLDETEAAVIRDLAAQLLAGEPLVSLTQWFQDNEIRTVVRREWRTVIVRNQLLAPRMAGLREHQGQVIGKAIWPAIISEDDHARIVALLGDPARRTNRTARSYLLRALPVRQVRRENVHRPEP